VIVLFAAVRFTLACVRRLYKQGLGAIPGDAAELNCGGL